MRNMKSEKGVVTMEACIVVPLFIILMLLMNGLFILFMGQQIMAHAAVQSAKSLALDPYASQRVAADKQDQLTDLAVEIFAMGSDEFVSTEKWYESADVADMVEERFMAYLGGSGDAEGLLDVIGVEGGSSGLDFSGSTLADGVLTMNIKYTQNFVYGTSDLTSIEREITMKVKLFEYKPISG